LRKQKPVHPSPSGNRLLVVATACAVFEVLRARGLTPSEEETARINASADLGQIKAWLRKSATASQVSELFD
jgi:hypothetical protein